MGTNEGWQEATAPAISLPSVQEEEGMVLLHVLFCGEGELISG